MRAFALLLLLLIPVTGGGCRKTAPTRPPAPSVALNGGGSSPNSGSGEGGIPARSPLTLKELPSDPPAIALGNLEAELVGARQLLQQNPRNHSAMTAVGQSLLAHGALYGKLAEYEEAAALVEEAVKLGPKVPDTWLARAQVRSRFHRFDDALADLARAEQLGAGGRELEQRRASILQAQGKLTEARRIRQKWVDALPTFHSLFALATIDADEGNLDEAERGFIAALQHVRDVSPFPIARLWLQEASMWIDAGRPARARELLEAARDRVPVDASILSHLSATYAATREPERAIEVLRPLVKSSDDPEHAAQLADLLSDAGTQESVAEARTLRDQAAARFGQLLAAHPEAFADHAARFYLRGGSDPARAAKLADLNLKVRTTESAWSLALEAHTAAGNTARACELAAPAVAAWPRFAHLHVLAAKAYMACNQQQKADAELEASRH